ncbi:phage integrase N-terminal SAM-like domain-containing protein [Microbulbifer epialgicus]|uniref:Phage integrase N-terminal SAM-like domain-containing protein n=1 Tax=Microbulbifer epialgicus TaxID=393907 RepID=A0ABV4NYG2_9GAMM
MREADLTYRTEQTYVHWIKLIIHFHKLRHAREVGIAKIEASLSHLPINRHCLVNTQRIALNALVYLYKRFLGVDTSSIGFTPAKQHRRLPIVYSREEIRAIISKLKGVYCLQVELMYDTGLRSADLLSLRVNDIDFGSINVFVRGSKGNKNRTTILPQGLIPNLRTIASYLFERSKRLHTVYNTCKRYGLRGLFRK